MTTIVIYASRYGTAAQYAMEIAAQKKCPVYTNKELPKDLSHVTEIIYIGAVYMGKILDFDSFVKKHATLHCPLIVLSVGMYDPNRVQTVQSLEKEVKHSLGKSQFHLTHFWALPGRLTLKSLSLPHKLLVNTLYKSAKKKPAHERSPNEQDIIAAYEEKNAFSLEKLKECPFMQ